MKQKSTTLPAAIQQNKLLKRCEVYGKDNAQFNINVKLLQAMSAARSNNISKAKELLGEWRCSEHRGSVTDDC